MTNMYRNGDIEWSVAVEVVDSAEVSVEGVAVVRYRVQLHESVAKAARWVCCVERAWIG